MSSTEKQRKPVAASAATPSEPPTLPRPPVVEPSRVLCPGAVLLDGRYRLLAPCGGVDGLEFWHATDLAVGREVALTIVASGTDPSESAEMFGRTIWLCRIRSAAVARILDMVGTDSLSLVVAEWIPSVSLREAVGGETSPSGAARAATALAEAVAEAHELGTVLSLDGASRVRVSLDGAAYLAFPGTRANARPEVDLHGLGRVLGALTSGSLDTAPLPEGTPPELSTAIAELLRPGTTTTAAATADTLADVTETARAAAATVVTPADADTMSPRRLAILSAAAVTTVLVLGTIGWLIGTAAVTSPDPEAPGLAAVLPVATAAAEPAPPPAVPVIPVGASVFSPQQFPDNSADAGLAIDANFATGWSTDSYRQQFPAFKNGVGLVVALPPDTVTRAVWIVSSTPGARVEIRTPPPPGGRLEDTTVLGEGVLGPRDTTIALRDAGPASGLLVWISGLTGVEGSYHADLAEIGFTS
ncbi:hypothetical protein FK531_01675 [Rhodococcus spelaei]|uniref:Peptidoglycan lipid II flippase n=1 Tax=Rhodococcus spelaei TaxID=2546320 RepID=A0A541BR77_9NOCA|nr:hypothetical protein [Rhodococcus spelaei]TQF74820.1 hypothetical protein FK531_01675 [Rhodococcus spelaei]